MATQPVTVDGGQPGVHGAWRQEHAEKPWLPRLLGESAVMQRVRETLLRVARSPCSTVLLTGESGTGKDLAAQVIHYESSRGAGPFINITCTAIAGSLLESELFGHERGAFTNAHTRKQGLFELGNGGTIFLDEIGEMSVALQAKLLRFLEDKSFRRVGGAVDLHPDVRVIAATNRDLDAAVRSETFRQDLLFRLAVLPVRLPPLRERGDDVELLARHTLERLAAELGREPMSIHPAAMRALRVYPWPGNVRELRNALERAVVMTSERCLVVEDFPMLLASSARRSEFVLPPEGVDFVALEKDLLEQALERTGGHQARAAALLGLNRDQIRYRIRKFSLQAFARPSRLPPAPAPRTEAPETAKPRAPEPVGDEPPQDD